MGKYIIRIIDATWNVAEKTITISLKNVLNCKVLKSLNTVCILNMSKLTTKKSGKWSFFLKKQNKTQIYVMHYVTLHS